MPKIVFSQDEVKEHVYESIKDEYQVCDMLLIPDNDLGIVFLETTLCPGPSSPKCCKRGKCYKERNNIADAEDHEEDVTVVDDDYLAGFDGFEDPF